LSRETWFEATTSKVSSKNALAKPDGMKRTRHSGTYSFRRVFKPKTKAWSDEHGKYS
jgi:hypothetical protein